MAMLVDVYVEEVRVVKGARTMASIARRNSIGVSSGKVWSVSTTAFV